MNAKRKYPLLPFAQFVYDMTRWTPWVYFFEVKLRTRALSLKQATDIIHFFLSNHPVFQSRIDWRGRQYAGEYKELQQGPLFKFHLREEDDWLYVNIGISLIIADGYSIRIILEDIYRAFQGEALVPDKYWEYIEDTERNKTSQHYEESKAWLEHEFANQSIPVRPTIDKRCLMTIIPPKVGINCTDYSDIREDIQHFQFENHLTLDGFISLCAVLAIAEYCGTDEAALTWAYDGRQTQEEQHIFGCLHRDVPFRIKVKNETLRDKRDLIKAARNQIRLGIAHSDYPYTLTKPYTRRWNYAVNVLRVPDIQSLAEQFFLPVEILSLPQQKYAYALLDVEIIEHVDSLQIRYRYSATHYKPESIRRFAALVRKYAEWLLN